MAEAEKKLILIDGMPLLFRAYFVFMRNPRLTSSGVNTSAIFGYTTSLLQILEREAPSHIGVAFDVKGPTFRHKEFKEYKANREAIPEDIASVVAFLCSHEANYVNGQCITVDGGLVQSGITQA